MISLRHYGAMSGCVRPRQGRNGAYYTKEQQAFRKAIRALLGGVDVDSIPDGPLEVRIAAYYKAPKSQKEETVRKTTSPDLDNIEKPIYDSLFKLQRPKGKRWDDNLPAAIPVNDSRICKHTVEKYSTHNEELLGMHIDISPINDDTFPTYRQVFDQLSKYEGRGYGFKNGIIDSQKGLGRQIQMSYENGVAVYENGDTINIIGRKGDQPWIVTFN